MGTCGELSCGKDKWDEVLKFGRDCGGVMVNGKLEDLGALCPICGEKLWKVV